MPYEDTIILLAFLAFSLLVSLLVIAASYDKDIAKLKSKIEDLQSEQNFREAELRHLLDAQFSMKMDAMDASRAILREAMRRQQDPWDK